MMPCIHPSIHASHSSPGAGLRHALHGHRDGRVAAGGAVLRAQRRLGAVARGIHHRVLAGGGGEGLSHLGHPRPQVIPALQGESEDGAGPH